MHAGHQTRKDFLIGDSHLERLSRPALSSLFQQHLSNWHNFGIGGDRVEHVAWRLQHGACPDAPGKVLLWMGTNNIKNNNSKELETIANTICNTVSYISNKFLRIPPCRDFFDVNFSV